ncbi:hypothetical protein A2U01_0011062, partial [Trifolium medium]|nr:hypothetical protein [Trifolium medium]
MDEQVEVVRQRIQQAILTANNLDNLDR